MPEILASFLYPFAYAPLGEGAHISGELFGLFLGVCLSPTPSRQPLFETSEIFAAPATHPLACGSLIVVFVKSAISVVFVTSVKALSGVIRANRKFE